MLTSLRTSDQWAIQARGFRISCTPFAHNFWALAAPDGHVVDQLHGLAVDPSTGDTKAIGNATDLLQVVHDPTLVWSLQPGQPVVICCLGSEADIRERWNCALNATPVINALQIPYPDLWQHFSKMNSNSVFSTLGYIMGFETPEVLLPPIAPGIKLIISPKIIDMYR